MRFLMLNWRDPQNPRSGGAERVTLAYLKGLVDLGHEVYWFAPLFNGGKKSENLSGIHMVRDGNFSPSVPQAVAWYREQDPFDLVVDQHHGIPWFAPWWAQTNTLAYIHEVLGPIWDVFYRWPYNVIGKWQERTTHWLYRNVPFWTGCEATKQALKAHGIRQITTISYGVDTVPIPELDTKPLCQPLRLATVSRLAVNKRVDHAIRLLPLLKKAGIQSKLTIVGNGEDESRLKGLVYDLDLQHDVEFKGNLPENDKNAILRQAHLLLHTSIREGWGLNVVEANAMGTPAVVYPVHGLTESTLHNVTGWVAESETPQALCASILALRDNDPEYQSARLQAWDRAKTLHWSQVLPRACQWLEEQAKQKKYL